ncbi:MAG: hypothetical protein AAF847_19225 [Bacteroidota bacterium]
MIQIQQANKSFKGVPAVQDLNLQVDKEEILGQGLGCCSPLSFQRSFTSGSATKNQPI